MGKPHLWTLAMVLGLSLGGLSACDDKDDDETGTEEADADTDADTDTDTDVDCASLDVDSCAADSRCQPILGRPMSAHPKTEAPCVDFSIDAVPLGCMDAEGGCGDAETIAGATEGACDTWFSSTCLPQGWFGCDVGKYEECPGE